MGERLTIKIELTSDHRAYLEGLVAMGRLGETVEDAARHILIRELDTMFKSGYHKTRMAGIY